MSLVELSNKHGTAVISSHAGATLRSLRVRVHGHEFELLTGGDGDLDVQQTPGGVGSFIMAPWVNRIHRGVLVTEHGKFNLPVDSGEHAIHGTVRRREWDVVKADGVSVELRVELREPWPFKGQVVYRVALEGPALLQTLEVHAGDGERSFPAGAGWHPWFRRSIGSGELAVQADAVAQWELDPKIVPTGKLEETASVRKLCAGGRFGVGEVDGCFQLVDGGAAEVRWPELVLRMTSSPEVTHVMVYSPAGSVCVEPQTTAVNAFQLERQGFKGTGTRYVAPGIPLAASTTWAWSAG